MKYTIMPHVCDKLGIRLACAAPCHCYLETPNVDFFWGMYPKASESFRWLRKVAVWSRRLNTGGRKAPVGPRPQRLTSRSRGLRPLRQLSVLRINIICSTFSPVISNGPRPLKLWVILSYARRIQAQVNITMLGLRRTQHHILFIKLSVMSHHL